MREDLPTGTVTFLFTDVEGSSDLVRSVGDDAFASVRAEHRRLLRSGFEAHGGVEIDTAGDGFFVAFESARAALRAAIAAQMSLAEHARTGNVEVRVRMGLHTGEPYLAEDGYVGIGVHRAARICDAARGGQILISNATAGIVEDLDLADVELVDLGLHRLKGIGREQRLFQVTVDGLPSQFGRPRTESILGPGTATFLTTDLNGFGCIVQTVGDEASAAIAVAYLGALSDTVDGQGGVVIERVADTLLAAFLDASGAIRAAMNARQVTNEWTWPSECDVRVSAAIHSGRWSGDPQHPAASTALSRLGKLMRMAEPGQILVSQATAALIEGDRSLPALRDLDVRETSPGDNTGRIFELPELL